jgi:hypothetical protein
MQPRVKGVAFRAVDSCYLALRGPEAHARARELLTPELRHAFADSLILAASWYPIDWYRDLLRSCRAASKDSIELMRTIGFESVKRDMASIYKRLFARVVSPQLLFSISARVFNTYYEQGKFEVPVSERGHCIARVSECMGWDANMWTEITGGALAMLDTAGARQLRLHTLSGGRDGDTASEFEVHWIT